MSIFKKLCVLFLFMVFAFPVMAEDAELADPVVPDEKVDGILEQILEKAKIPPFPPLDTVEEKKAMLKKIFSVKGDKFEVAGTDDKACKALFEEFKDQDHVKHIRPILETKNREEFLKAAGVEHCLTGDYNPENKKICNNDPRSTMYASAGQELCRDQQECKYGTCFGEYWTSKDSDFFGCVEDWEAKKYPKSEWPEHFTRHVPEVYQLYNPYPDGKKGDLLYYRRAYYKSKPKEGDGKDGFFKEDAYGLLIKPETCREVWVAEITGTYRFGVGYDNVETLPERKLKFDGLANLGGKTIFYIFGGPDFRWLQKDMPFYLSFYEFTEEDFDRYGWSIFKDRNNIKLEKTPGLKCYYKITADYEKEWLKKNPVKKKEEVK